jgi:diguanylate cyclase (GGDEF)-like protein/PAS domain S-box-containing protein
MIHWEKLLQSIFLFSGVLGLGAALYLTISQSNGYFLIFAPISCVGFALSIFLGKYLSVTKKRAAQLSRHVEEISLHLNEQERLNKIIRDSEALFRGAFESASVGKLLVTTAGTIKKVNKAFCRMLGREESELVGCSFLELISPDDKDELMINLAKLLDKNSSQSILEIKARHGNGESIWISWSASLIDQSGGLNNKETNQQQKKSDFDENFIFHIYDITDRKRAEERLTYDAFHDGLTDLANRALFLDRLDVAFKRSQRHFDSYFAVAYLDLDRFKFINDTYGHQFGDLLLKEISKRLSSAIRESDTVARLGGDEFAIIIEEAASHDEVDQFIKRLVEELNQEYKVEQKAVFATFSIGVAFWNRDYKSSQDILRDADIALYQAKRQGRNQYTIFQQSMLDNVSKLLKVEMDLRKAVSGNELMAFYQPIISFETEEIVGFEALIRWNHSILGNIPPSDFIPVAEETGLIIEIGEWILKQACSQLAEWQKMHPNLSECWVSVNVSCRQLYQSDFVPKVAEIIRQAGILPKHLKLEITESMMIENLEQILEKLKILSELGVNLSIDDFGTGYSSLNILHRLPLHTLKIDRSFINDLENESESAEIIKAIISLANNLRLDIIAEGIETPGQADFLKSLNCKYGQGYLFGRPLAAESVERLFRAQDKPAFAAVIDEIASSNLN